MVYFLFPHYQLRLSFNNLTSWLGCLLILLFGGVGNSQAEYLLVSNNSLNSVLRYDATTGAFIDQFVPGSNTAPGSGGLESPVGLAFGPDGNLYVSSAGNGAILRYNGQTGAFINTFAIVPGSLFPSGVPQGLTFGPDGNLYVSDSFDGRIDRFNGQTGAFMGVFSSGVGLFPSEGLVFGPDGNLYVASMETVMRFDGITGVYLGDFAVDRAGARELTFGPDGNLYVTSADGVDRFNGQTGLLMGVFASSDTSTSFGLAFGPDQNLYVSQLIGPGLVQRFNGTTGAFIENFVESGPPNSSSWLVAPYYLVFSPGTMPAPAPSSLALFCLGTLCLLGYWACRELLAIRVRRQLCVSRTLRE